MSVTDEFDPEFERVQQIQAKKNTESKDEIASDLLDRRRLAYTRLFRGKANETDIGMCGRIWKYSAVVRKRIPHERPHTLYADGTARGIYADQGSYAASP
jgi:hypothetical protein